MQVDEPALAAVANAQVPTASGFGRHRRVDPPELSAHLEWVVEAAIAEPGPRRGCTRARPQTPWALVAGTGVGGLSADLDMLGPADLDVFAEALEAGRTVALGVVPSTDPAAAPSDARLTERVQRWLDMLGLDPEDGGWSTSSSPRPAGCAGATPGVGRQALPGACGVGRRRAVRALTQVRVSGPWAGTVGAEHLEDSAAIATSCQRSGAGEHVVAERRPCPRARRCRRPPRARST